MTEENVSNIAQASFLVGAGLYVGFSLLKFVMSLISGFLTL